MGYLFVSDTVQEKRYSLISFQLENSTLRSDIVNWAEENPPNLGTITVLGVQKPVTQVIVNGVRLAFKFDTLHKVSAFLQIPVFSRT